MILYGQTLKPGGTQLLPVRRAVGQLDHPVGEPVFKPLEAPRLFMILREAGVVTPIVTLHRGGMRATGFVNHGRDQKTRDERAIRI